MSRIVSNAKKMAVDKSHPLAWYMCSASRSLITDNDISKVLQEAAAKTYDVSDPDALAKWTSHSIRVGACVSLHETGALPDFIKNRLRWRSDAFLMYLRNTPQLAKKHSRLLGSDPD
jgi:hypothetical protein